MLIKGFVDLKCRPQLMLELNLDPRISINVTLVKILITAPIETHRRVVLKRVTEPTLYNVTF